MEDEQNKGADDVAKVTMICHLLIRDKDTGEILVNQRDDLVHQGILGSDDNAR